LTPRPVTPQSLTTSPERCDQPLLTASRDLFDHMLVAPAAYYRPSLDVSCLGVDHRRVHAFCIPEPCHRHCGLGALVPCGEPAPFGCYSTHRVRPKPAAWIADRALGICGATGQHLGNNNPIGKRLQEGERLQLYSQIKPPKCRRRPAVRVVSREPVAYRREIIEMSTA
jgi:hypothetical protein